jgi:hypothetical protein
VSHRILDEDLSKPKMLDSAATTASLALVASDTGLEELNGA